MTRVGFRNVGRVFFCLSCACGSSPGSESSGPVDGSTDGFVQVVPAADGSGASTPDASGLDASAPDASGLDASGTPVDGSAVESAATDGPFLEAAADAAPIAMTACDNAGLLAGCTAGPCTVGATGNPLPDSASITVTQRVTPADLSGDTLGSVLCSIALPVDGGVEIVANLSLTIALTPAPDGAAVLFQYFSPSLSRIVPTSPPSGDAVVGLVTAPGDFGATERPAPSSLQGDVGVDVSSSADEASLLRNLSSQPMEAAYYDGTHLFVCNGARLLVYSGIPGDPGVPPAVVLGQNDLDSVSPQTTSSLFGNTGCAGLWSDGTRLVVANGNRILIWNAIPTRNAAPADIVLGQPDFSSNVANSGGVGAASLSSVASVDSDGTRLTAAEVDNQRVLIWNEFPTAIDQPADFVIGQPDFTSNEVNNGATPIYQPWASVFVPQGLFISGRYSPGIAHFPTVTASNPAADFVALGLSYKLQPIDALFEPGPMVRTAGGGLAIRDIQRVAMLKTLPVAPTSIDFVLGQPDRDRIASSAVSASTVSGETGLGGLGAGNTMCAADSGRLLVFDDAPTFNFEPASRVIGQAGFSTNGQVDYRGISASTLAGPADVAIAGGVIAVADRGNSRVLLYRASDVAAGSLAASVVLGQPDAGSYVPNLDQKTPSAARLSGPAGVALDGTHLIVSDTENHRVLIWSSVPSTTATPADLVLGQADFVGRKPNRGNGDMNGDSYSDSDDGGFFYPTGVASDGTHLFVADRLNNRVLVWNSFPTSNGQAADAVIGQPDFVSSLPNASNGSFTFVPNGLDLPTGVTLVGTTLWVADTENNRLVRYDNATTSPTPGAFVGQSSGSAVANPNYYLPTDEAIGMAQTPPTAATSVLRPRAVAVVGGTLYVSEADSNRVHMLDSSSFAPLGELGQSSDSGAGANGNGISASSLTAPLGAASDGATLWVADSGNHRVLGYGVTAAPSTGAPATLVLGQPSLLTNGFNQSSTAANGATAQPRGVALSGGLLYVADTGNSRVLVFATPVAPGQPPVGVYGQPTSTLALANSGGAPSANTLSGPQGVFADSTHVIIADTGNHRVLVYDTNGAGAAATLVLGQSTFATSLPNAGGASASTLQSPTAAYSDGTSLWISDTGNHRVLVWNAFPTSNGQAADLVLGQSSPSDFLPNQGGAAASASSLSFPAGLLVVNGVLYIADTGNNRVVSFSTMPTRTGASADGVLGQADLVSRGAAATAADLAHLAGPTGLAADGENLYVADRDLARVLQYNLGTITSGAPAALGIGAVSGLTLSGPEGIAAQRTPFFTSRLYVADTGNSQVAVIQSVSRLTGP